MLQLIKDIMWCILPVGACVKYLVSDELEHCAQWPQRGKKCVGQPGHSVGWIFSVRMNQSASEI